MSRRDWLVIAIIAAVTSLVFNIFIPQALANEHIRDPEVKKGIGIVEGIHDSTLQRLQSWQGGCERQFKANRPVGVESLLKEYVRRIALLKQEAEKLKAETRDDEKAVFLTENSFKIQSLVRFAASAAEPLFDLLKAGCVIEMKAE